MESFIGSQAPCSLRHMFFPKSQNFKILRQSDMLMMLNASPAIWHVWVEDKPVRFIASISRYSRNIEYLPQYFGDIMQ